MWGVRTKEGHQFWSRACLLVLPLTWCSRIRPKGEKEKYCEPESPQGKDLEDDRSGPRHHCTKLGVICHCFPSLSRNGSLGSVRERKREKDSQRLWNTTARNTYYPAVKLLCLLSRNKRSNFFSFLAQKHQRSSKKWRENFLSFL